MLTVYDLMGLKRDELIDYYKTLDAPDFKEMAGEYRGMQLDFGGGFWRRLLVWVVLNAKGDWIGKAFTPETEGEGKGYNLYRHSQKGMLKLDRMKTFAGPSFFDEGHAFHLDYSAYSKDSYVDEIRKVKDGLYLGIVRNTKDKDKPKWLYPFILEGPVGKYEFP